MKKFDVSVRVRRNKKEETVSLMVEAVNEEAARRMAESFLANRFKVEILQGERSND